MATVGELAGIGPDVLRSSSQRRSVGRARIAAAHILRTHCRLPRTEIGSFVGRSDQTVSDLTARADAALATGGPVAELIRIVSQSLDDAGRGCVGSIQSASKATATNLESRLTRRPVPALRAWRRDAGFTQQTLAAEASISRETLIRIEAGRPAVPAVIQRLANALGISPAMLLQPPPADHTQVQIATTWIMRDVAHWRKLAGWDQAELAERAGVARETLIRIENGRPARRAGARRLAEALILAPSELIGTTELDAVNSAYRRCRECGAQRPLRGFVRVKGTPYVYLRCRLCRAKRARDRYRSDPIERERQKARKRAAHGRSRLAADVGDWADPQTRAAGIVRSHASKSRRRSADPRAAHRTVGPLSVRSHPELGQRTFGGLTVGLEQARLSAGLTQAELAARAGIARETLIRLERLRRRAQGPTVNALAWALGVQPSVLTTGAS
jgi:transcriptional regulator with XRE-family HTH domain